jgi:predicted 3-demethylubiquinone-9 3-methyltransferase (glyoxalase superfamily)
MPDIQRIVPCLWFDREAEEAAGFYTSIFPDSRILDTTRYGDAGREIHGMPSGSIMTVEFELSGQRFTALNGGPVFRFNEAISFQVECDGQEEMDHYWDRLRRGGDENAQQCGWLKDRYGVSWQVTSRRMYEMLNDPDRARADRAMTALLSMKRIDLAELERAYGT